MKNLRRVKEEDDEAEEEQDEDSDSDDENPEPKKEISAVSIKHMGCINRLRVYMYLSYCLITIQHAKFYSYVIWI